ncbi:MAG: hypothetical protein J7M14_00940 [Planctomycetes bacterium]|nr:hypothetical protein [Planctomycetota bacterium]
MRRSRTGNAMGAGAYCGLYDSSAPSPAKTCLLVSAMVVICSTAALGVPVMRSLAAAESEAAADSATAQAPPDAPRQEVILGADRLSLKIDKAAGALIVRSVAGHRPVLMRISPIGGGEHKAGAVESCNVIDSDKNQATMKIEFAARGKLKPVEATVVFDPTGSIAIEPGVNLAGVRVEAPMRYAVIPSRLMDQTICPAAKYAPAARLHLPAENLFLGLSRGGRGSIILAWPGDGQTVKAIRNTRSGGGALFEAVEVMLAGKRIHIKAVDLAGIWHRRTLTDRMLEKNVQLKWRRPFKATWIAQLKELQRPATFLFANKAKKSWAPGMGRYQWPAWFEGDKAFLHLGKKIPPEGEAIIFPLVGHVDTPYGFLLDVLTGKERQEIIELAPTKSVYSLNDPREPYVWPRHCDGHKRMKATILQVGNHFRERELMCRHIESRVREDVAVAMQAARARDFLADMNKRFDTWTKREKDNPKVLAVLDKLRRHLTQLEDAYKEVMREGRTPAQYTQHIKDIAERFKEAVQQEGPERLAEMRWFLRQLNEPKSRIERLGSLFGYKARGWFVAAPGASLETPQAVRYVVEIRRAVRKYLEHRAYESRVRYWDDLR